MWLDIFFLLIILVSIYRGYKKGLLHTIFSSLALIIAILATMKLSPILIQLLENNAGMNKILSFILGIVLVFLLFYVGIDYLGKFLEKILRKLRINFVNKVSGAALSVLISIVILSFVIAFLDEYNLISEITRDESISYDLSKPVNDMAREIFESLKPYFREFWDLANAAFGEIRSMDGK